MNKILSNRIIESNICCFFLLLVFTYGAQAQQTEDISLHDMKAFENPGDSWSIAGGVTAILEEANQFEIESGSGILINTPDGHGEDLITHSEHGDIDLELEFMLAKDSNSGIYFQGRYEMQLLDSWATKDPTSGDNGGIYERWDESRPDGKKGYQGYAPRQNTSRAPGLWQQLKVSFQAPRFNNEGKKVENAKIISASLNGVTIHEDVELLGPTRGAIGNDEVARGPLRIQGDHGAIAFRNIAIKNYDQTAPVVNNLEYQVYEGSFTEKPNLDTLSAIKSGTSKSLTANLGSLPDQFLLRYTGTLQSAGSGEFTLEFNPSGGAGILLIDGEEVISAEQDEGTVSLAEGNVSFELLYVRRGNWGAPRLGLSVVSENLRRQLLSDDRFSSSNNTNPIFVKAKDKPLLRSFMDLPNGERLTHAVSVSSTDKLHYTYDLNSGNVVQLWRGNFLNATPMWYNRGDGSSRPEGSIEYLVNDVALPINKLEDEQERWSSDTTGTGYRARGYRLNGSDEPTFLYDIYGSAVEDKIRVISEGKGVERTLHFDNVTDGLYLRLATGETIKEKANNRYLIGDQSYYLEMGDTTDTSPIVRTIDDHQELIVPVQSTLNYTILF